MRLRCWPRRRSARLLAPCGGGPDLISALPDDLLLLVLARLPCAGAAARTAVLSRRWRGLWAHLGRIVFREVALPSVEAALGRVPRPPPAVSLLNIRVPDKHPRSRVPKEHRADTARVNSLLRAAARLEPKVLLFELPSGLIDAPLVLDLPRFDRATFIVLNLPSVIRRVPAGVEFPALETLILYRCTADLNALLSRCPRLRTLHLISEYCDMTVNSSSLRELGLHSWELAEHVNIVAPVLKQLTVFFRAATKVSISVLAPMVEMVSWTCRYSGVSVFGIWRLEQVKLRTAERQGQLPKLHIDARVIQSSFHDETDNSTQEIEKHLVAAFSVLELHLTTEGHAFGAFVFHLLGMNQIRCATRRLKVILQRSVMEGGRPPPCPCESLNWRSQPISVRALEEVEISGFEGDTHEIDFLKLILKCAPILKRIVVKLSLQASASKEGCTKICSIFKAHSSVECAVYHSSGLMHDSRNCWWT